MMMIIIIRNISSSSSSSASMHVLKDNTNDYNAIKILSIKIVFPNEFFPGIIAVQSFSGYTMQRNTTITCSVVWCKLIICCECGYVQAVAWYSPAQSSVKQAFTHTAQKGRLADLGSSFIWSYCRLVQGRFYVEAGGNCPPPFPNLGLASRCDLKLFYKLKSSAYRRKQKRSVAFKLRQNAFPVEAVPGPSWELTTLSRPPSWLGRGGDTPPHTPTHLAPILPSLLLATLDDAVQYSYYMVDGGIASPNIFVQNCPWISCWLQWYCCWNITPL